MEMDLKELATFDIVLFLGSLYHMENPLAALKRVAKAATEAAIIESEAAEFVGYESHAICEFFENNELNGDISNWWAPNEKALSGLCRAARFKRVNLIAGVHSNNTHARRSVPPNPGNNASNSPIAGENHAHEVMRYRAVVHAWK